MPVGGVPRQSLDAVINLRTEPRLRRRVRICTGRSTDTVLIDRRRCPVIRSAIGAGTESRAGDRALSRRSVAPHSCGRSFSGRARRAGRVLAGVLVRTTAVPRRRAGQGGGVGLQNAGGAEVRAMIRNCHRRLFLDGHCGRLPGHGGTAPRSSSAPGSRPAAAGRPGAASPPACCATADRSG